MEQYQINKFAYTIRAGWTVIELIFIIVIIGILASMALSKLSSTRDDAKLSVTVHNMAVCLKDAQAYYTATGNDYTSAFHPAACDLDNTECYDITYSVNGINFNVAANTTRKPYCADINNVGGHLVGSYSFGHSGVVR